MKRGTTPTLEIKLELNATNVTNVYFTFKEKVEDSDEFLLQKNYPEDATYDDEKEVFLLPLTQEDTLALTDTYFLEAEVVIGGKSVIKSDIGKEIMQPTLYTEVVSGNESNDESDVISLSFTDYVKGEGGSSGSYNDLSDKPRFNDIVWQGNKTDSDMGIATKGELQTKADKSDTYTKSETNNLLSGKQNTITGGNGIDVSSDVVSVDIYASSSYPKVFEFINGKLAIDGSELSRLLPLMRGLGYGSSFRQYLVDTAYSNPLASKTYVDNLISGTLKRLVVESLPTQDIDTNTIYMIRKSVPSTNNIYDEYMYINNAWELIGSTEVDLSNYYTKTESDNRYNPKLSVSSGLVISSGNTSLSVLLEAPSYLTNFLAFDIQNNGGLYLDTYSLSHDRDFRLGLISDYYNNPLQPKLTAGTNITIDANNVISASGSGTSYTFTDGLAESSGTVGIDIASGSKLLIDANDKLDVDLSSKQDTIDSTHKLSADLVDDTSATNKFVTSSDITAWNGKQDEIDSSHKLSSDLVDDTNNTNLFVTSSEKSTWNGKADNATISTDTTSTTVSLTLADNHEYRYTQDLASLTLTMPSGDFIASIVFASGSTPTSMTYDSNIKWSGDDVTNGQFVPTEKTYNIVMWYDGINVNGVVRGV